ncbi:MAG: hypothetical protein PWR20_1649 [Bacteroidales bacterium]|jgi:hypothetical protein|nr:hypothetical protein [Bacteroidales bacterium]
MEPIDKQNIEAWFLDYFEGRLDPENKARLMDFLKQNPDLLDKFLHDSQWMGSDSIVAPPLTKKFTGISFRTYDERDYLFPTFHFDSCDYSFNKPECTPSDLKSEILTKIYKNNKTDWENACIAYLEGDLSKTERKEFEEMLTVFPELNKDLSLFRKAFFIPEKVVFPGKNQLKKKRQGIKVFWSGVGLTAAAATIALLLMTGPQEPSPSTDEQIREITSVVPGQTPMDNFNPEIGIPQKSPVASSSKTTLTAKLPTQSRNAESLSTLPPRSTQQIELADKSQVEIEPINRIYTAIYANMMERWQAESMKENKSLASALLKPVKALFGKAEESLPGHDPVSLWTLAEFTLKTFNTITDSDIELKALRDEEGRLKALAFGNENFKIAHLKKNYSAESENQKRTSEKTQNTQEITE